jgi:hypothetical protein
MKEIFLAKSNPLLQMELERVPMIREKKPPPFWLRNFSQHDVAKKVGILHCGLGGVKNENIYSQLFCFTKLTHGFQFFHLLQGHIQTCGNTNCIGEVCDLESIVKIASFAGYHCKSYYHNFPKIKKMYKQYICVC